MAPDDRSCLKNLATAQGYLKGAVGKPYRIAQSATDFILKRLNDQDADSTNFQVRYCDLLLIKLHLVGRIRQNNVFLL